MSDRLTAAAALAKIKSSALERGDADTFVWAEFVEKEISSVASVVATLIQYEAEVSGDGDYTHGRLSGLTSAAGVVDEWLSLSEPQTGRPGHDNDTPPKRLRLQDALDQAR